MSQLEDWLNRDEAVKIKPYLDCCRKAWRDCVCVKKGKLTIGVGRNLDDDGISVTEAFLLRDNDIAAVRKSCSAAFPWVTALSPDRQDVVCAMVFNMGLLRFCDFKLFIQALEKGDFVTARSEMLDSKWAAEVGDRAKRYADVMCPVSAVP